MRKIILMLLLTCVSFTVNAQNADNSDEKLYEMVDQMPVYPGGMEALMKYMSSNLVYPKDAEKKKLEGKSLIGFIVEKDGSITDVKVVQSSISEFDAEAMRVVKGMPKWKPGKNGNTPVRVQFNIPVWFRLK